MKSKEFSRKLVLGKQTITNIDHDGMNVIKGGATLYPICPIETKTCISCTCRPTFGPGSCRTTICA